LSVNLFGVELGTIFLVTVVVLIVLLGAVLIYQIRLIRNISFLKSFVKETEELKEERQETPNPAVCAAIIAAINLHKSKQRQ
jgi:Na+-transporting methylmalonyl-CoA/oxaloacetate decarboxylase gamma subunit